MTEKRTLDCWDYLICGALWVAYIALLLGTVRDLGYARDEGFYFQAAHSYEAWFDLLRRDAHLALDPGVIDRYWAINHEHPSFMKSLFAFSHHYLFENWAIFREQGTAYRFPGMAVSALAVAVIYAWGRREMGRLPGLVAALSFALMPRVFYHSHLACFDVPVASMLLISAYLFHRSLEGRWPWALAVGVQYGLLLDTKHNAWLLPGAFVLHFVLTRGAHFVRELRQRRLAIPLAFFALVSVSPLVFYACWPWIWHDTTRRLQDYAAFHLNHEYYNMEFLGQTYWKPPMPRLYAWVMTLGTVPGVTLALFGVGLVVSAASLLPKPRARVFGSEARISEALEQRSATVLWLLCLLLCYAPWWSNLTPIFGGTKHWITAYPFLCLLAGRGFAFASEQLKPLFARPSWAASAPYAFFASVLIAPLAMTLHSHPWGLSFYTPLVGGAPGAADLGLNRTFWGYTTGAVQGFINSHARPRAAVYVHDTALQSWEMLRSDGRVRSDLHGTLGLAGSDLALYHHEPHMHRVEYELWVDYGSDAPKHVGVFDGVPVVWVYER